jgi:hypothetical protein
MNIHARTISSLCSEEDVGNQNEDVEGGDSDTEEEVPGGCLQEAGWLESIEVGHEKHATRHENEPQVENDERFALVQLLVIGNVLQHVGRGSAEVWRKHLLGPVHNVFQSNKLGRMTCHP